MISKYATLRARLTKQIARSENTAAEAREQLAAVDKMIEDETKAALQQPLLANTPPPGGPKK